MPKQTAPGTIGFGGLPIPLWLRALFAWRVVRDLGVYRYEHNILTGARRARRLTHGCHGPVDRRWVETGRWSDSARPPAPSAFRGARPGELAILGPNERAFLKPRIRVPYRRVPGPPPAPADWTGVRF